MFVRFFTVFALLLSVAAPAQSDNAMLGDQHRVAMQRQSSGTFYLSAAFVDAPPFSLLVDTGSSYMVIPQDMLDALLANGQALFDRHIGGRMADESLRKVPIYKIKAMRLGESCWLSNVQAAVFPAGTRPILGMHALERLAPFQFSVSPAELLLSRCELLTAGEPAAVAMP